ADGRDVRTGSSGRAAAPGDGAARGRVRGDDAAAGPADGPVDAAAAGAIRVGDVIEAMHSCAWGLGALAAYAVAVPVVLRLPGRVSPVARQVGLALLVHAAATLAALRWSEPWSYWHGAALYWCGFVVTLFGHSAVYKSVSLGILGELAR